MYPVIYTIPVENHGRCGRVADMGREDVQTGDLSFIPLSDWSRAAAIATEYKIFITEEGAH